jgi:hypothetical protein
MKVNMYSIGRDFIFPDVAISAGQELSYPRPCLRAAFPSLWTVEPMPSGYRVIDANGIVLAHVYGQLEGAIAIFGRSGRDRA